MSSLQCTHTMRMQLLWQLQVPKERRIANIGSLPLGAILSPVKEMSPGPPVVRTPPIACENCGEQRPLRSSMLGEAPALLLVIVRQSARVIEKRPQI
jgi:hypothetical protein